MRATVARRYRLVSQAGSGGMAEVWRAIDTRLDRTVAVKLLLPELAGSARARQRAVTEARTVARINHPNVAAVYDAGHRARGLRRPVPYLVMEYVDGETLDHRLTGPASLDWRSAAHIAAQVADGLAAAHLHRVVHRDVKPGNIMFTASGVKVVDFGLASIIGSDPNGPLRVLLGTPEYMAPEQLRGEQVTLAVDLYALGLVLYHMLTGGLPWTAATRHALTRERRTWGPVRLPPMAGVPADIVALVDACLADDPDLRPSARFVATTLRSTLTRHGDAVGANIAEPPLPTAPRPERPRHPCTVPWRRERSTSRRRMVLVAAAVLVAVAGWARPFWPTPAATAGDEPAAGPACSVRYVGHRAAARFAADLTVIGNAEQTWTIRFTAPPGQRVTSGPEAAWTQTGAVVTVTGQRPADANSPVHIDIAGVIDRPDAGFPTRFELNGTACQRAVSIYAVAAADG